MINLSGAIAIKCFGSSQILIEEKDYIVKSTA